MTAKSDRLVTLFGGGGFIGRYVAQSLLNSGMRVRIAQRDPRSAYFIRPLARLGQIHFVAADVTRPDTLGAAVSGSDAVVNLVGTLKGAMRSLHVEGARNVAIAAAAARCEALVQISAIGADIDGDNVYATTKGLGEQAVHEAFPSATIVRPSIVFGQEDDFINRFARLARIAPVIPVIRPNWKSQPVSATDLGHAIAAAAINPIIHAGMTYELGGPEVMTMFEINGWVAREIGRGSKPLVKVPDLIAGAMATLGGWLPGAPITRTQFRMLGHDNVASGAGFEAFDMRPMPLAAVADEWLTIYRRRGRFARRQAY
jgi:NADH dehydrogenase